MRIVTLTTSDTTLLHQAGTLLVESFTHAWPSMQEALEEVHEGLAPDGIMRGAVNDDSRLLDWVGGNPQYEGHVWELHPLVVDRQHWRQGIGRALVQDLETQVKARGGITIQLGTDDEDNMTSLSGVDLYPDPLAHVARIRNLRGHPYEFYQKLGYTIIGVVPDANGWGRPDILMAKRIT